ncbi:DoxX family protein [Sphingobacterium zeae]|uniref:Oxidoreductase n=1 Tax=Sphingobacterium zeae TaxID=1776859 RepID=A0ABU0U792_9SPHI|nr:DoxX family protein [Sphingobacterium zeae]MDQ1150790.1 putative oxidoreductase [Sphingobacterium zeae]
MGNLIHTEANISLLILRVVAGIIILPYGLKKIGWKKNSPGKSFQGTIEMGVPYFIVFLLTVAQTLGAASLLFGFLVRISALGNFIVMSGALVVHFKDGWSMNWYGKKNGEGIEYFVLILCILFVLMLDGGGLFSFDRFLMNFFCY